MAKKKETTNEAEVAATAPEELGTPVSAEHGEPAAAPVVANDGGGAAEAQGGELPGEPPTAAQDADGSVSDEVDTNGAGIPAQTAKASAEGNDAATADPDAEPPAIDDVVNDSDGSADGIVDGGADTAADAQSGDGGDIAPGDGGAAEGTGDPDGCAGEDDAPAPVDPSLHAADDAVIAAELAANCVREHVAYAAYPEAWRMLLFCGQHHSRGTNAMAACIRNIGPERAQPPVLAQQLKILELLDEPELTPAETLVVKIFADTLAAIDAFNQAEAARLEAQVSAAKEPAPWPMDETTLEGVDEPLATY